MGFMDMDYKGGRKMKESGDTQFNFIEMAEKEYSIMLSSKASCLGPRGALNSLSPKFFCSTPYTIFDFLFSSFFSSSFFSYI